MNPRPETRKNVEGTLRVPAIFFPSKLIHTFGAARSMSHNHDHGHSHGHAGHHHDQPRTGRKPVHKDWRVWVIVGLMLLGMLVYILTLDESIRP